MSVNRTYLLERADPTIDSPIMVAPYSTNGPKSPSDGALHDEAVSADTTLTFVGKGLTEYGDIILQNLLYLLENFSSKTPPVYPTLGQMWFNSSANAMQRGMHYWNGATWKRMTDADNSNIIIGDLNMQNNKIINLGDPTNAGDATNKQYVDDKTKDFAFRTGDTFTGPVIHNSTLLVNSPHAATFRGQLRVEQNTLSVNDGTMRLNGTLLDIAGIGSEIRVVNGTVVGFGGNIIQNIGDPQSPTDAVNLRYLQANVVDGSNYAKIAGDTFTGIVNFDDIINAGSINVSASSAVNLNTAFMNFNLNSSLTIDDTSHLNVQGNFAIDPASGSADMGNTVVTSVADPLVPTDAANKKYVDDLLIVNTDRFLIKNSIDTVTGSIAFSPTSILTFAKHTGNGTINFGDNRLQMTGDPTSPTDAANKRYVDDAVNNLDFGTY